MTKNTVWLISGGVNYYLSGGASTQTVYAGSGTPWTAESTTPYELALNDLTGPSYTPQAAPGAMLFTGGIPFSAMSAPVLRSYDRVTETLGVQMVATTKDNAIALLKQLGQILNTALYSVPCVLAVTGGTNTTYFEIYGADIQETPSYIYENPSGRVVFRAAITWIRSALGAKLSSGETLINAQTFGNTGTGSPSNVVAYSAATGDLINEGSPLNVSITPVSGFTTYGILYAASIATRTYTAFSGSPTSVSAGSSLDMGTAITLDVTEKLTNAAIRYRIVGRFTSANVALAYSVVVSTGSRTIYSSPNIAAPQAGSAALIDFGWFSLSQLQRFSGVTAPSVSIQFSVTNTGGVSYNATPLSADVFSYYTMMSATTGLSAASTTKPIQIASFAEQTNAVCLPLPTWSMLVRNSTNINNFVIKRGTPPRYYPSASLWLAWVNSSSVHVNTETATVTVTHSPLYRTLRGGL